MRLFLAKSRTSTKVARSVSFEIYLEAMERAGADTTGISRMIEALRSTNDASSGEQCLCKAPPTAADFVHSTFRR
jgi:hypothetical protein